MKVVRKQKKKSGYATRSQNQNSELERKSFLQLVESEEERD